MLIWSFSQEDDDKIFEFFKINIRVQILKHTVFDEICDQFYEKNPKLCIKHLTIVFSKSIIGILFVIESKISR